MAILAVGSFLLFVAVLVFILYRRAQTNAERLRIMFDHAPLAMMVLDEENRVRIWNRQAEKTFLWKEQEVIGKRIIEYIVPSEARPNVESALEDVHAGNRIIRSENVSIRKDGQQLLCEWVNAPFRTSREKGRYVISMAWDITERKRLERELELAAHYDNLTGLPNRALILELLKQSMAIARRQGYLLAVLFMDLDKFKHINDSLGHTAGDQVLRLVAGRLQNNIREGDHAGRLAGDEFLVILQNVRDPGAARHVADKLRSVVAETCQLPDCQASVTASIGISMFPEDSAELEALIHQADQAMYRDKMTNMQS